MITDKYALAQNFNVLEAAARMATADSGPEDVVVQRDNRRDLPSLIRALGL